MQAWHDRLPKHRVFRWAAGLGLAGALAVAPLSATAQGEVQTSPIAATPPNCVIQLSVANPTPGDQEIPRSLIMSGTALDGTATSGTGISRIQAFVGNRDAGGTIIGTAAFTTGPGALPGAWSLTATIPTNISGGQQMFVYGLSSVSGQEAMVTIPIVISEAQATPTVPNTAQSFCPTVMAPNAAATPAVAATPFVAATPQPTASAIPPVATPTPQPAPANPPVTVPPTVATQLSISSPNTPPLSFDTTTLTAPAGASVTVTYTNNEIGVSHNWRVFNGPDSSAPTLAATQLITGPGTTDSVTFTAPTQTGNYFFWCDVHPTIMTGTLVLQ